MASPSNNEPSGNAGSAKSKHPVELEDYCVHCMHKLANDYTHKCEYIFGNRSLKCTRCKELNYGKQNPCVTVLEGNKDQAKLLVAAAREYRAAMENQPKSPALGVLYQIDPVLVQIQEVFQQRGEAWKKLVEKGEHKTSDAMARASRNVELEKIKVARKLVIVAEPNVAEEMKSHHRFEIVTIQGNQVPLGLETGRQVVSTMDQNIANILRNATYEVVTVTNIPTIKNLQTKAKSPGGSKKIEYDLDLESLMRQSPLLAKEIDAMYKRIRIRKLDQPQVTDFATQIIQAVKKLDQTLKGVSEAIDSSQSSKDVTLGSDQLQKVIKTIEGLLNVSAVNASNILIRCKDMVHSLKNSDDVPDNTNNLMGGTANPNIGGNVNSPMDNNVNPSMVGIFSPPNGGNVNSPMDNNVDPSMVGICSPPNDGHVNSPMSSNVSSFMGGIANSPMSNNMSSPMGGVVNTNTNVATGFIASTGMWDNVSSGMGSNINPYVGGIANSDMNTVTNHHMPLGGNVNPSIPGSGNRRRGRKIRRRKGGNVSPPMGNNVPPSMGGNLNPPMGNNAPPSMGGIADQSVYPENVSMGGISEYNEEDSTMEG